MTHSQMAAARGLLLDLDGTLADTIPELQRVYSEFLVDHGVGPEAPHFDRLNGLSLRRIIALMQHEARLDGDPGELERDYRVRIALACEQAKPNQGARDLLQKASAAGYRTAVVTSGDREPARAWLERTGLSGFVCEIVGAADVRDGKPSPEPYRLALEKLSTRAGDSVAVEDSMLGAQSAVAAGLMTYVLADGSARDAAGWPRGAHFVDHLTEVTERL